MSGKAKGNRGGGTIVIRREEGEGHGHHGGAWKVAYADFVTAMMAFFLLMWLLNATTEEQRRGIADYFAPANPLGRTLSGTGLPFGGRTPQEEASMMSNQGAIRPEQGPQTVVMDVEEDDTDTPARPAPLRDGPPGPEEIDPRSAQTTQATPREASEAPPPAAESATATAASGAAESGTAAAPGAAERAPPSPPEGLAEAALRAELARRERAAFDQAAQQLREAVRSDPALADLARQLLIEQTPEGLRIQLLDAERQPMFALGGSAPNERARALLARVAQAVARLPNAIAIAGHTDATPFRDGAGGRSNWDLSAERANATRRLLVEAGVAEGRIRGVAGHAEREPLVAGDPAAAANRRVAITLLRQAPPPAAEAEGGAR